MNRSTIINSLIKKNGYKSYLEIGCQNNRNFNVIVCKKKTGVDPVKGGTVTLPSDIFFRGAIKGKEKFDIIFIDGDHTKEQVAKDIKNSLSCLSPGGTIVVHDLNPSTFEMQAVPRIQKAWTGNGWEAWVKMRMENKNLLMCCFEGDYGVGIIQKGSQDLLIAKSAINFNNFVKNKKKWMNMISWEEVQEIFFK